MKIEKLTENKIRVIVNTEDLKENDIDFNLLMNKSMETQNLFFEILEKAEEELDFHTDGYKLLIEAFSSSDEKLVFTITKYLPKEISNTLETPKKKKLAVKRKSIDFSNKQIIYSFNSFEEFCNFCSFINNNSNINVTKISKNISLYFYNDTYYLALRNVNTSYANIKLFYAIALEFGKVLSPSKSFENKLMEHGEIIIKKNAIQTGIKYFINIHSFVDYMPLHLLLLLNVNVVLLSYLLNQQLLLFDLEKPVYLLIRIIYYNGHNMFVHHYHEKLLTCSHMNLYILKK